MAALVRCYLVEGIVSTAVFLLTWADQGKTLDMGLPDRTMAVHSAVLPARCIIFGAHNG
jgi:hypothetical protein